MRGSSCKFLDVLKIHISYGFSRHRKDRARMRRLSEIGAPEARAAAKINPCVVFTPAKKILRKKLSQALRRSGIGQKRANRRQVIRG